jgi:glutamine synthetase
MGQNLPRNWHEAIERLETSAFAKEVMGARLHRSFVAVKHAGWERLAHEVSEAEWALYGFVV